MAKFYRLLADPAVITRWYLKGPRDVAGVEVDSRNYTRGVEAVAVPSLSIPLRRKGDHVDFNFGDFDIVVTPASLNEELGAIVASAIQRIPVHVENSDRDFEILNVVDLVDCIDEVASEFTRWTKVDGRPDKVGTYRSITHLRIDGARAKGHQLFRVHRWPIALIASESVKVMLENRKVSGLKFDPVN